MNLRQIALAVMFDGRLRCGCHGADPHRSSLPTPKNRPFRKRLPRARRGLLQTSRWAHIYEQQYEATSSAEYATKAIEAYKKSVCARSQNRRSSANGWRRCIGKAQRIHDAVTEAQGILKTRPRQRAIAAASGADLSAEPGRCQRGQRPAGNGEPRHRAVPARLNRLDPSDTESALWLARLYRLKNEHDKAEQVLRGHPED